MQKAIEEWMPAVSELRIATSKYLSACATLKTAASDFSMFPSNHMLVADLLAQVQPHMESIAWVENNMRNSCTFISGLRNESPIVVSMHKLPSELLARIFRHAEATTLCTAPPRGQGTLLDIMLVCSLWRRIAINTRSLWSHIDVHSYWHWHRQSNRFICHIPDQVELRLERSFGLPIHLHVPFYPLRSAPEDDMIDLLQPYTEFLASITAHGEHYWLFKALVLLCATLGTRSYLKSITASSMLTSHGAINVLNWSTLLFPGLVELNLSDLRGQLCPSPFALLSFLSETPSLHTLRLKDLVSDSIQQPCLQVALPHLKLLELSLSKTFLLHIVSALCPGTLDLDVRLDLNLPEHDNLLLPVQGLLTRSNVASLTLQKIQPRSEIALRSYLESTTHLRALVFEISRPQSSYVLDEFVAWMLEDPVGRLSRLQALCIIEGRMDSNMMYKVQNVVSVTALKHLCFLECSFSPSFGGYLYSEESDDEMNDEMHSTEMPKQARDWFTRWIKRVAVYAHRPDTIYDGEDEFIQGMIRNV